MARQPYAMLTPSAVRSATFARNFAAKHGIPHAASDYQAPSFAAAEGRVESDEVTRDACNVKRKTRPKGSRVKRETQCLLLRCDKGGSLRTGLKPPCYQRDGP